MARFWENETPKEARSEKNVLRWYPKAGQLQVSRPDYEDNNGQTRPGKSVTLNVSALREESDDVKTAARSMFEEIISRLEG